MSSLENYLFRSFAHFKLDCFVLIIDTLLFSVCRGQKSCWIIKGHCRKNCKSGEQVKKPCKNGDYCCILSKTDSQPHRLTQAPTGKSQILSTDLEGNDVLEHVPLVIMRQGKI
uniref:Beta-defensin n=1 Tax=Canis lupus dingo TaxID=286419 RepID=A0A8C0JS89_CANLU